MLLQFKGLVFQVTGLWFGADFPKPFLIIQTVNLFPNFKLETPNPKQFIELLILQKNNLITTKLLIKLLQASMIQQINRKTFIED